MALNYLVILFLVHPFHVSICEIEYNDEEQTLQITHRMFIDDLENGLSDLDNKKINLHSTDLVPINEKLDEYLQSKFSIAIKHQEVTTEYLGFEIENEVIWCYQEAKNIEEFTALTIKNTVLFHLYDDQQNIIHIKVSEKIRSLRLHTNNVSGNISFM